jgi:hypothetical protein
VIEPALVERCITKLEAARADIPRKSINSVLGDILDDVMKSGKNVPGRLLVEIIKALHTRWGAPALLELLAAQEHEILRCACYFKYDVTELLQAYGECGALQEALAFKNYKIMRDACKFGNAAAVTAMSAVYGVGSDGLIAALSAKGDENHFYPPDGQAVPAEIRPLSIACFIGHASIVKAITAAAGGPGCEKLFGLLSADNNGAINLAACYGDDYTMKAVVEAYGGPATAPLLALLQRGNYNILVDACRSNYKSGVVDELCDAYGGLGSAELQKALEAGNHGALYACRRYENTVARSAIAKAYGGRTSPAYKAAMAATKKNR